MKKKQKLLIILLVLAVLIIMEFNLFLVRAFNPKEIDDIHPNIECSSEYFEEADIIWVIPKFNGTKISDNQTWCEEILGTGKEIGMHGYTHEYLEFANETKEDEIEEAMDIFEDCFKFKPELFKAPQLKLSVENAEIIKENNMTIKGKFNSVTHKIYHCSDTGIFSNKFIRVF